MQLYQIQSNYYLGHEIFYSDHDNGIPNGYTRTPPPETTAELPYVKWDGCFWSLTSEPPPAIPPEPKIISKLGFLNRLGLESYAAIIAASKTDALLEAWINILNLRTTIDLNSTETQNNLATFVTKGLLTQEKADKIVQDPLSPSE